MPDRRRQNAQPQAAALKSKRAELKWQMKALGPLMRGSLVLIGVRNKQPYFTLSKGRKTQLIYLGKKREGKAREYSNNYHRLLEIVEEMTQINMKLLKLDACD